METTNKSEASAIEQFGENFYILFKELVQQKEGKWRPGQIGGYLEDIQKEKGWPTFLSQNKDLLEKISEALKKAEDYRRQGPLVRERKAWLVLNPLLAEAAEKMTESGIDVSSLMSASAPR